MQLSSDGCPIEPTDYETVGTDVFQELFIYNSEICNGCFTKVRDVGPEVEITLQTSGPRRLADKPPLKMDVREWFQRTEFGSQEHSTWESNKRFGSCYCIECGSDCTSSNEIKSLERLHELRENIQNYVEEHTDRTLNEVRFREELEDHKRRRELQGWDDEILAIAFSRALYRKGEESISSTRVAGGETVTDYDPYG